MSHAERALALEPELPQALEVRGTARYWHWLIRVTPDPEQSLRLLTTARADLESAVDADPTLASAWSTLSHLYYQTEEPTVSVVLAARTAYQEDAYLTVASEVLYRLFAGHYDLQQHTEARRWCEVGRQRFPEDFRFSECQLWLMTTDAMDVNVDLAWQLLDEVRSLAHDELHERRAQMMVGGVLARAQLPDSSRTVLLQSRTSDPEIDPAHELLSIEAYQRTLLGDFDQAIDLLLQYIAANPDHDPIGFDQEINWQWRSLRNHERWREVTRASR